MSLTSAFSTARNSLLNTATQLSTSAKNIENASNTSYSRKNANLVSGDAGNTSVVVARAGDAALFLKMLDATSNSSKYAALLTGLTTLQSTIGDTETDTSVAARLSTFQTALSSYANAPDNDTLGQAAITAAENLATALNSSTRTVQSVRAEADANIANSVSKVNDLLSQFKIANDAVIAGTVKGDDISDALDARDAVLSKLSEEMGVTTVLGQNNDMKLYTDGGATLFDQSPRSVTFVPSATFDGTTVGNAVYVDGVAVTGASSVMPLKSGAIAGYAQMRDVTTVTYQDQLDEVARGLISAFRKPTSRAAAGQPNLACSPTASTPRWPRSDAQPGGDDHGEYRGRRVQGRIRQHAARRRHERRRLRLQHDQCRELRHAPCGSADRDQGPADLLEHHAADQRREPPDVRLVLGQLAGGTAHVHHQQVRDAEDLALAGVHGRVQCLRREHGPGIRHAVATGEELPGLLKILSAVQSMYDALFSAIR